MRKDPNPAFCQLIFLGLFFVAANSCTDDTEVTAPIIQTADVHFVSASEASCGGEVISDGGAEITARGVCWSSHEKPTIDDNKTEDGVGEGIFSSLITGLDSNSNYYVRAYATNRIGTSYGNSRLHKSFGTISDIDGNVYKTVLIGDQLWMAENLKTTRFKDGSPIANVRVDSLWAELLTPAYCWYENNPDYKDTYGALYNWMASKEKDLCPTGWHVSSDVAWNYLIIFLGQPVTDGHSTCSHLLKEAGTSHWDEPNLRANNRTRFTALPGGSRNSDGIFTDLGRRGAWWGTNQFDNSSWSRQMYNGSTWVDRFHTSQQGGLSVRCVKDE